jgi:hypothetical protein
MKYLKIVHVKFTGKEIKIPALVFKMQSSADDYIEDKIDEIKSILRDYQDVKVTIRYGTSVPVCENITESIEDKPNYSPISIEKGVLDNKIAEINVDYYNEFLELHFDIIKEVSIIDYCGFDLD